MQRLWPSILVALIASTGSVLAQSNPFDGMKSSGAAVYADPIVYEKQKAQWLARVAALPKNVDVLEGAADFFLIRDRPLAQDLLERARTIEPTSPRWPMKLAQLHKMNAAAQNSLSEARIALTEMERSYDLTPTGQRSLPSGLAEMAFEAGDLSKARTYAERLLDEAKGSRGSWDHGNKIHKGNLVLGRIAVREGRIGRWGERAWTPGSRKSRPGVFPTSARISATSHASSGGSGRLRPCPAWNVPETATNAVPKCSMASCTPYFVAQPSTSC